ncbi:MAG: hypothetical protein ACTSVU_09165 [Promethearchaeota archaeon]
MSHLEAKPAEIFQLLQSPSAEENNLGYSAFLKRCHWTDHTTANDLKNFACSQLNLNSRLVLAKTMKVSPALLYASQDGLDATKLQMVDQAMTYSKKNNLQMPPVIVWYLFDSQTIRWIVHDGHHRVYEAFMRHQKINAVVLEPLGNYTQLESKFWYAFHMRKRAIDLIISDGFKNFFPQISSNKNKEK